MARPFRRSRTPRAALWAGLADARDLRRARAAHRSGWMFVLACPRQTRRWMRQIRRGVGAFVATKPEPRP